jgi:GNAT superfamily N-acetyltransferase
MYDTTNQRSVVVADLALTRRLEQTEAKSCVEFVETRNRLYPVYGASWIKVAGAYVLFDGLASPLTQTFGLGLFDEVTSADLATIERFYEDRGAAVFHEVSPVGDARLVTLFTERGYHPVEYTSVMYHTIDASVIGTNQQTEQVAVGVVDKDEYELWGQTTARGWSHIAELAETLPELMRTTALRPGNVAFLAELDGQPVAGGVLYMKNGVALLGGASTVPEARNQGAHRALVDARLKYAAQNGCDIAMVSAQPPGGPSQRNAERHGFRIAYTRTKWGRD